MLPRIQNSVFPCELVERKVGPRAITKRIRGQDQVNTLRRIDKVKRPGISQPARTHCSAAALEFAATRHIEFVNDDSAIDIGYPDMQGQV
jgi:hypothetical protein